MFHLQQVEATCTGFNVRAEKHGDEPVSAGDFGISVDIPNAQLEQFDSSLRDAMFRAAMADGEQPPLIGENTHTALRFPRIKSWKWGDEYTGCELEIGAGLNLAKPLTLVDVRIKGFELLPKEGGTVTVNFKAQVHPDEEAEAGRLCFLIGKPITVSLKPPIKIGEAGDLLGGDGEQRDVLQEVAEDLAHAA